MTDFLFGAVNTAAFLLCAAFLAYVASIAVPLLRHRAGLPGIPTDFRWHFLIPSLNEEQVVAATVYDLTEKFPSAEIWCIDDASTDATHQIVSDLARANRRVHVVTRELPNAREGKGPALNAGWEALVEYLGPDADFEHTIVGVIDADGTLDPLCPEVISGPSFFGNPRVGAVQIMVRVVNEDPRAPARVRILTRLQDIEFSCVIAGMQMLRRHVGSTAMGGNGQFTRLSALQAVAAVYGTPWEKALLEDFELGLRILLTGGETEYCHDTWVAQQGPATLGRLMRQRSRWAQGLMQCFRYFIPVMRSRQVSTGAAMEIAVFLLLPWFQLFGIVVYLVSMVVLAYWALSTSGGPIQWLGAGAWGLIPLFVLFGLGPLAMWGPVYRRTAACEISRRHAFGLGLANWPYSYIHHVSTWWAFGRVLRARNDWKKTERLDLPARRQGSLPVLVAAAGWSLPPTVRPVPAVRSRPALTASGHFRLRAPAADHEAGAALVTGRLRTTAPAGGQRAG